MPPDGIEGEHLGKDEQGACHTANGCHVGGDLPPHIDQGTDDLDEQRRRHDVTHEMGDVQIIHPVGTGEVTEDTDDIGHHSTFLVTQLDQCPTLITAIEVNQEGG